MGVMETEFIVYEWHDEDLRSHRRLFVRHLPGAAVTKQMVLNALEDDIHNFPAARYRAVPVDRMVDLTVRSTVVLP